MNDTTNKPMTLEQVRDELRAEAKNERLGYKYGGKWHDRLADAISAHLAAQREGEAVAWLVTREGDPAFPFVFIKEDMADRWISNVTLTPFAQKHPLYATLSHPRVEVTADTYKVAAKAYNSADVCDSSGNLLPNWFEIRLRAALEAALSEKGHG